MLSHFLSPSLTNSLSSSPHPPVLTARPLLSRLIQASKVEGDQLADLMQRGENRSLPLPKTEWLWAPPLGGRGAIDSLTWPTGIGLMALIFRAESLFSQHGRRLGHPFSARVVWEDSRGRGLLCWQRALELTKSLGQEEKPPLDRLTHKS